jgi:hypothetical protein
MKDGLSQTFFKRNLPFSPTDCEKCGLEYESVLKRGVGESGLSAPDIDVYIEYLCSQARLVQVYFRWRPMLPDPNEPRDVKDSRSRAA